MFYDNYVRLCSQKGVSPSFAAQEMGLSKQAVSHWKSRGNVPSDLTLQRIADYFDVPKYKLTVEWNEDRTPKSILIERINSLNDEDFKRLEDILRLTMPEKFKD